MNVILKNLFDEKVVVEIKNNEKEANFITHRGNFHADEVMATCILLNVYKNMDICRVNEVSNPNAFAYDVGFGKFDHHQADFCKVRENGIKYASCGLVWKAYGKDIIRRLGVNDANGFFNEVDRALMMDVDRDDNGQPLAWEPAFKIQSIPSLIGNFNPCWNDEVNEDEAFLKAISFANVIFNNVIKRLVAKDEAKKIIDKKIDECDGKILILDKYMPWKDVVLSSDNPKAKDILYAVFPSKRGGYNVVATPVKQGSFDVKKPFPKSWAGLDEKSLKEISTVSTIRFCHKNLFICACDTYEDAIKIANISIKNNIVRGNEE